MKTLFSIFGLCLLSSCCQCYIYMPELYPIPEEWELVELTEECDAREVIPSGK